MAAFAAQGKHSVIKRKSRGNRAFIVEAIVLFVFLVVALSVVCLLLFASADRARQSRDLEHAITLAANTAERFSANPLDRNLSFVDGDLTVISSITEERSSAGTLYQANIVVTGEHGQVYQLDTSRYVSGVSQ